MKRFAILFSAAILSLATGTESRAQRVCGTGIRLQQLASSDPAMLQQIRERRQQATAEALAKMEGVAAKTTAQNPIPVVFHFILTPDQYISVGRDSGIRRRVYSQLRVLNEDFNRKNADSNLIPAGFKSRFANVNIQFGLARGTSGNTISDGIEVKVLPTGSNPIYDVNVDCYTAKQNTAVGLPSWDVSKYLNIWVVNITSGGSGTVVGVTTPPSSVGYSFGTHTITDAEKGVVLNYGAVGARDFPTQFFIQGIDKGRTLTHEMGHYFELWHIWGDDAGKCPNNGGQDDMISDTPPQADATYCNGGVCPNAATPKTDGCSPNSPGIMFMNFMDYVDDRAMQMFTPNQAARMVAEISASGPSYSLTQNPDLLATTAVRNTVSENAFRVYPNPATDLLRVEVTGNEQLIGIEVLNLVGQSISHTDAKAGKTVYDLQLAAAPRGIYFVHCRFGAGTTTKKIVLQ